MCSVFTIPRGTEIPLGPLEHLPAAVNPALFALLTTPVFRCPQHGPDCSVSLERDILAGKARFLFGDDFQWCNFAVVRRGRRLVLKACDEIPAHTLIQIYGTEMRYIPQSQSWLVVE